MKKLELRSKLFQRYKPKLIDIFSKFLKFLILKLGKSPHKVDVKKGLIKQDRKGKMLISIKDPFIKYINHGLGMDSRDQLKQLYLEASKLLEAASEQELSNYIFM